MERERVRNERRRQPISRPKRPATSPSGSVEAARARGFEQRRPTRNQEPRPRRSGRIRPPNPVDESCSICGQSIEVGQSWECTPCGHFFHAQAVSEDYPAGCLRMWLEQNPSCPIDRNPLRTRDLTTGVTRSPRPRGPVRAKPSNARGASLLGDWNTNSQLNSTLTSPEFREAVERSNADMQRQTQPPVESDEFTEEDEELQLAMAMSLSEVENQQCMLGQQQAVQDQEIVLRDIDRLRRERENEEQRLEGLRHEFANRFFVIQEREAFEREQRELERAQQRRDSLQRQKLEQTRSALLCRQQHEIELAADQIRLDLDKEKEELLRVQRLADHVGRAIPRLPHQNENANLSGVVGSRRDLERDIGGDIDVRLHLSGGGNASVTLNIQQGGSSSVGSGGRTGDSRCLFRGEKQIPDQ